MVTLVKVVKKLVGVKVVGRDENPELALAIVEVDAEADELPKEDKGALEV